MEYIFYSKEDIKDKKLEHLVIHNKIINKITREEILAQVAHEAVFGSSC